MNDRQRMALAQVMLEVLRREGKERTDGALSESRVHPPIEDGPPLVTADVNKRGFGIDGIDGQDTGRAILEFKRNAHTYLGAELGDGTQLNDRTFNTIVQSFQKVEGITTPDALLDDKTKQAVLRESETLKSSGMRVDSALLPLAEQSGGAHPDIDALGAKLAALRNTMSAEGPVTPAASPPAVAPVINRQLQQGGGR